MSGKRPSPARLIIADDHQVVREGLATLLERRHGMRTVAFAASGDEVVEQASRHDADVLVLDLWLSDGGGVDLIEAVHARRPGLRTVVYSMSDAREWAARCLSAGAWGFVSKSSELDELAAAIHTVLAGRRHVGPDGIRRLVELGHALGDEPVDARLPHERLSNREYEIFRRLAEGESLARIADALGLSPKTVSTYRGRILAKFGYERNADLTRYAIRHGLTRA